MAEDELMFDTTMKKKKKKKKAFDPDSMDAEGDEDAPTVTGEAGDEEKPEKTVRFEEPVGGGDEKFDLDLESFGKKKKKKKKAFDLDALEDALPAPGGDEEGDVALTPGGGVGEEGGDDFDLDVDFTKLKKKKKKKDLEELIAGKGEDEEGEVGGVPQSSSAWGNTDRDYTYDELLARVFDIMREKNPDMVAGEKKKFVMKPPQVVRVGTKKVSFANFTEICRMLHRQQKHVLQFLLAELGTQGSVDGNNQLIIKGRFQQKQIENVLRRYIVEYVTCKTCRSPDTELNKGENRLYFVTCNSCGSRRSVTAIKTGFSAQVGKRKRMQG
jgi:translation initiation factor 2 subunit 2